MKDLNDISKKLLQRAREMIDLSQSFLSPHTWNSYKQWEDEVRKECKSRGVDLSTVRSEWIECFELERCWARGMKSSEMVDIIIQLMEV